MECYLGTDCNMCDMLKVPGMKTFLKLDEHPRNEAKPRGFSRSQDMKTGHFSSPEPTDIVDSHRSWALEARSLLVRLQASLPLLYATWVTQSPWFSGIYLVDIAGLA